MLLDAHGRPMKARELSELQAEAGITSVRQAWQGSIASGLTPVRLAAILRACDEGSIENFMILAEEMEERDTHYAAVMGQRKRAISGVRPRVEPASEASGDKKIADWVEANIARHEGFSNLVEDLLDAIGKGFSVVEIDWGKTRSAQSWEPRSFIWRPQSFFTFDRDTGRELRLRDEGDLANGIELSGGKFIVHHARLKSGHVFRAGIARVAAFSWMCKSYTLKDWMAFIETYGLPLRIGKYHPSATKKDVQALFRAVANIGTDAAAVIPQAMDIELVDNKSGGGSQPIFENLARYIDEGISKIVLGQTMTTDDGSSQAQATIHNEVRHDIADADGRAITGTLARDLVRVAVDLNFGPQKHYPRLLIEPSEPEDIEKKVTAVTALAKAGVAFRASEARALVGMSDPEQGDELFGGTQQGSAEARADTAIALGRPAPGGDVMDEIEAEMLADWEPDLDELLGSALQAVDGAGSYEEAMERLAALPGLPTGRLINTLVKGMFKARSLGDQRDG